MNKLDFLEDKETGLELIILCHDCKAIFEINKECLVWALAINPSFLEFKAYMEQGKCPNCRQVSDE